MRTANTVNAAQGLLWCAIFASLVTGPIATAEGQDEVVLDKRGALEVILEPQESPRDGLVAAKIVLKADTDRWPQAKIVTLEGLAIEGNVQQVFLPDSQSSPTATPHAGFGILTLPAFRTWIHIC